MIYLSSALYSFLDFKIKRFRLAIFLTVEAGQIFKARITQRRRITVKKDKTTSSGLTQSQQELRHIIPSLHQLSLWGEYSSVLFI